jgi:hypothetical protein
MLLRTLLVCAALLHAVTAAAQTSTPPPRPERPYRGLFGGGVGNAEQLLTVNVSLGAGYDDNIFGDGGTGGVSSDPRTARGGSYGVLSGGVSYSLDRRRIAFGASVNGSTRYYSDVFEGLVGAYGGTVGGTFRLSEGQTLRANQSINHQPYLQLVVFPQLFEIPVGQGTLPSLDFATAESDYFSYDSSVEYTAGVGRRGSLSLSYGRQLHDFETEGNDFTSQGGHAAYVHRLTQGLGLRLGYGHREGRYPAAAETRVVTWQNWDVGLDYSRALSFSRRTKFAFSTGSSAIGGYDRTYYRLTGDVSLTREIGRTWDGSIAYSRGVGFIEAFAEPFFSDSFTVSFGGMMSRRLQFRAAAGGALGSVGLSGNQDYNTYYASASLQHALSRFLGLGTEYFYYRYNFDATAQLPSGMSRELDRQGVRAYISLWAPLIHRARRPDAPR